MKIIPAIDILHGKCVRLTQGNYAASKIYHTHPLEIAKELADHGVKHLHVVDLDGAKSAHVVNHRILEQICTQTDLHVDFGGGLKTTNDIQMVLECGAKQVTIGSIAATQPAIFHEWVSRFGSDTIILGADARNGQIATMGWQESVSWEVNEFIALHVQHGVQSVICTDISKDGMLTGPATDLYRQILTKCNVSLIASGGVRNVRDLEILRDLGCTGVIIGKALYERQISLKQIAELC